MSIQQTSPWLEDLPPAVTYPSLAENIEVDVAVVGGGIAGVMTAYELSRQGLQVALLEKGTIASGETGYTTAFITQVVDVSLVALTERLEIKGAQQIWEAGVWAINYLEKVSADLHINSDLLSCPAIVFASDEAGQRTLQAEVAQAERLGLAAKWHTDALQFSTLGYMQVPNQGKFHPRKFLSQLTKKLVAQGVWVYEKTKVTQLIAGAPHTLMTAQGTVKAKQVVLCTGTPELGAPQLMDRLSRVQTYAIEAHVVPESLPEALYWDTETPYQYFRVDRSPDYDRIILGGQDHPMEQPPEKNPHTELETYLKKLLPGVAITITNHWGGQIFESPDGLPLIGAVNPEKTIFMASGFSGNGMTFGAVSADINTQLITQGSHPWEKLFDPLRFAR